MKVGVFFAALLTSTITHAVIPINGWYMGLFGGYSYLPNNINVANTAGFQFTNSAYKAGFNAGGSFGYKSNPMRYEGEFTYIRANLSSFKVNSLPQTGVSGYASVPAIMANIYYDFKGFIPSIQPFLGFGIGYSWIDTKFESQDPLGPLNYTNTQARFSYQGTAGLTFNYSEYFSLGAAYRYFATDKVGYLGKFFQANLAFLVATYRFDDSKYK